MKRLWILFCAFILVNSLTGQDFEKILHNQFPNPLKNKLKKVGLSTDSINKWINKDARLGGDVIYYLKNYFDKMLKSTNAQKKVTAFNLLWSLENQRMKANNQFIHRLILKAKNADISESDKHKIVSQLSAYIIPLRADEVQSVEESDLNENMKFFFQWKLYSKQAAATYDPTVSYQRIAEKAEKKIRKKIKKLLFKRGFERILKRDAEFSLLVNYWYLVDEDDIQFGINRNLPKEAFSFGFMRHFSFGILSQIMPMTSLKIITPFNKNQIETNPSLLISQIYVSYDKYISLKKKPGFLSNVAISPFVSFGFYNYFGNYSAEETYQLSTQIFESINLEEGKISLNKGFKWGVRLETPAANFKSYGFLMLGISGGMESFEYKVSNKVNFLVWNGSKNSKDEILLESEPQDMESTFKENAFVMNPYIRMRFRKMVVTPSVFIGLKEISILVSF